MTNEQIVSKQRVADHGEVFTNPSEVNAMLDLVKQETERIDSRFLEPACGKGAFISVVLHRKLQIVAKKYKKSQWEYERYAVLAISSIYGIDILEDNVADCRQEMLDIFKQEYKSAIKKDCSPECEASVRFILSKNIIWGDALTLKRVDSPNKLIVFSNWSYPFNDRRMKRQDFTFQQMLENDNKPKEKSLLDLQTPEPWKPVKSYPPINYLRLEDADKI
ncbi:MAG: SAM-dependent DNA methyltransferase [Alphaproteobacteria bacterium]|nr:SAM-dependent DNA methyltransferase [Alphaproteobacteria bacterium]